MKTFLAVLFFCCFGCKTPEAARPVSSTTKNIAIAQPPGPAGSYQVARIDSLRNVYLIYARRNDTLFKIVSDKEAVVQCVNIKPGKYYHFKLRSLLYTDLTPAEQAQSIPGLKPLDTHHMEGLDYDGKGLVIKLEGDSIRDLYYAKNVSGLCFK